MVISLAPLNVKIGLILQNVIGHPGLEALPHSNLPYNFLFSNKLSVWG